MYKSNFFILNQTLIFVFCEHNNNTIDYEKKYCFRKLENE